MNKKCQYITHMLFQAFLFIFPPSSALRFVLFPSSLVASVFSPRNSCATLSENRQSERRLPYGNRSPIDHAASQLALARTAASHLDTTRAGYDSGQIPGLGQEMAEALT